MLYNQINYKNKGWELLFSKLNQSSLCWVLFWVSVLLWKLVPNLWKESTVKKGNQSLSFKTHFSFKILKAVEGSQAPEKPHRNYTEAICGVWKVPKIQRNSTDAISGVWKVPKLHRNSTEAICGVWKIANSTEAICGVWKVPKLHRNSKEGICVVCKVRKLHRN